jgi:hypothetical protein
MVWIKSATNGNVFEVSDEYLARQLEAEGHEVHKSDPRDQKAPKPKASK